MILSESRKLNHIKSAAKYELIDPPSLDLHLHVSRVIVHIAETVPSCISSINRAIFKAFNILRTELHPCEFLSEMLGVCRDIKLGFVRGRNFLLIDSIPVYAIKPRMLFNILGISYTASKAFCWILIQ